MSPYLIESTPETILNWEVAGVPPLKFTSGHNFILLLSCHCLFIPLQLNKASTLQINSTR